MKYNSVFSVSLPAELAEIASAIGRALDPDVGGDRSFTLSEDGLTISTSTPCTVEFAEQALFLLSNPEVLHISVCADYAARWGELVPPTLDDCTLFCSSVIKSTEEPNVQASSQ